MAIWSAITDYKLIDFGAVPGSSFLYRRSSNSLPSSIERVCYLNLPATFRGIDPFIVLHTYLFKFLGAATCSYIATFDKTNNAFDYLFAGFRLEYETYPFTIDMSTLSPTNNPEGTGSTPGPEDVLKYTSFSVNGDGNSLSLYGTKRISQIREVYLPKFVACRIGISDGLTSDVYDTTSEVNADGIQILNTRIDFH